MIDRMTQLNWQKMQNLIPAIVQDKVSKQILMLGYMDKEALEKTLATGRVIFFSRSKQALWEKGATSGNMLFVDAIQPDCDGDAILITANSIGPTCHQGTTSCFTDNTLLQLEARIRQRQMEQPPNSYVVKLLNAGIARLAQKVGEEGVEVALAAIQEDNAALCGEIADLLFHVLVLLRAKDLTLENVTRVLQSRAMY